MELKKDRECLHCKEFFECKGKPEEVKRCVNYTERGESGGREKNVRKDDY